jgi:hypothetical protein
MPLVEFKMHAAAGGNPSRREIPGFIRGSADFFNPADNTYVGWVADNRDFYLPDTIVTLDKAAFVARQLAIHGANPFTRPGETPEDPPVQLTNEEVTTQAEDTFDRIVAHCQGED